MSPRSRSSAKRAGRGMELAAVRYLADHLPNGDNVERRNRTGALDRGDVAGVRTAHGHRLVLECKDVATLDLPGWVREATVEAFNDGAVAGVVVHKRRGVGLDDDASVGEQFVTMRLSDLVALLTGTRPDRFTEGTS